MTGRRTETVSLGTLHLGTIRETDRGFETFGPDDKYLLTEVTIAGARRALFQHSKDHREPTNG